MKTHSPYDLAAVARGRRLDLGLSQQDLASRAGVSRKWISDLEGGKPRAEMVLVIAVFKALRLEMSATVRPKQESR